MRLKYLESIYSIMSSMTTFDQILSGSLKIVVGFLIVLIVTLVLIFYNMKHYIVENLDFYECKKYVIPFISWFDAKRNATDQMKKCNAQNSEKYFSAVNQKVKDTTDALVESGKELAEGVNLLTMSAELTGNVTADKLDESHRQMSILEVVTHYSFMKLKAFFDKLGALVQDAYFALLSIMDAVNVVFVIPDLIMKILAFMIMVIGLVLALLIFFFILNHVLGISLMSLGFSFLSNPFTAAFGASLVASGTYIVNMIAIFIYLSAITITLVFFGVLLTAYVPLKGLFDSANKSSYCCFSGTVKVEMIHTNNCLFAKEMAYIQLGEMVHIGGKVLGKLYVEENETHLNIHDYVMVMSSNDKQSLIYDLVYQTHPMYVSEEDRFVPVKEVNAFNVLPISRTSKSFQMQATEQVLRHRGKYCLLTEHHRIRTITSNVYKDYQEYECGSNFAVKEAKMNLMNINKHKNNESLLNRVDQSKEYLETSLGLPNTSFTYIMKEDGFLIKKTLEEIQIGDKCITSIQNNTAAKVIGIYTCIPMQECIGKLFDQIVPAHQIIFNEDQNEYQKAYMFPTFQYLSDGEFNDHCRNKIFYHFILENHHSSFYVQSNCTNVALICTDFLCV